MFLLFTIYFFQTSIYAEDFHPADTNHDWRISEDEFKAYNFAWKKTQEWQVAPNPIPASYSARAAYLFLKASCYGTGNAIAPLFWGSDKDCDGTIDSVDLCPDDPNKKEAGICGCGKAETGDRDNDKTLDCVDQCPDDPKKSIPGNCGCSQSEILGCPVDNKNGTVTYRSTCLMWQKQTATSKKSFSDAISYCDNLTLAGYSDWRLPGINELRSIVDKNQTKAPYINRDFFPDTVSDYYWSSSTNIFYNYDRSWSLNFHNCDEWQNKKSSKFYVRAVRGKQCR